MIQAISPPRTVFTPTVLSASPTGRRTVPVRPLAAFYARFEHVMGVPSRSPEKQVSLGKLRMLDIMIDRLVGSRSTPGGPEGGDLDGRVRGYMTELDRAASYAPPLSRGLPGSAGTVVDLTA